MNVAIQLLGDPLAVLSSTRSQGEVSPNGAHIDGARVRCVVSGADLRPHTRWRDARHHLRLSVEEAVHAVRRTSSVRHLVVVFAQGSHRASRVERFVMSALNRTHASLERDVARDVEFTAVNVTDCANPEMLATRLLEVSRSTVTHGVVVLGWDEVIGQPVGSAARRALS